MAAGQAAAVHTVTAVDKHVTRKQAGRTEVYECVSSSRAIMVVAVPVVAHWLAQPLDRVVAVVREAALTGSQGQARARSTLRHQSA